MFDSTVSSLRKLVIFLAQHRWKILGVYLFLYIVGLSVSHWPIERVSSGILYVLNGSGLFFFEISKPVADGAVNVDLYSMLRNPHSQESAVGNYNLIGKVPLFIPAILLYYLAIVAFLGYRNQINVFSCNWCGHTLDKSSRFCSKCNKEQKSKKTYATIIITCVISLALAGISSSIVLLISPKSGRSSGFLMVDFTLLAAILFPWIYIKQAWYVAPIACFLLRQTHLKHALLRSGVVLVIAPFVILPVLYLIPNSELIVYQYIFGFPITCYLVAMYILSMKKSAVVNGPPTCGNCGYNLTGNISGTCPECGCGIHSENTVTDKELE